MYTCAINIHDVHVYFEMLTNFLGNHFQNDGLQLGLHTIVHTHIAMINSSVHIPVCYHGDCIE